MSESLTTNTATYNPDRAWVVNQVVIDLSDHTLDRLAKIFSPVQHGYWEDSSNGWTCSICSRDVSKDYNYCPNCGAKMDIERSNK